MALLMHMLAPAACDNICANFRQVDTCDWPLAQTPSEATCHSIGHSSDGQLGHLCGRSKWQVCSSHNSISSDSPDPHHPYCLAALVMGWEACS